MHDGNIVVDAVSHVYDMSDSNIRGGSGRDFADSTFHHTHLYQPESYYMDEAKWYKEHTAEELSRVLFVESDVDYTIHHSLPIVDFWEDGMVATEKGRQMKELTPHRVSLYEAVNPLSDGCMEHMEWAVNELGANGIKLYPARYRNGQDLRIALNDNDSARPVLEKAAELDVDTVAVHKSLPIGPTATDFYKVDDVDDVADEFPDLNIEIVHAGLSFLEDATYLLAKHPNVYANFEITASLALVQPRKFAKVLGELLLWAGPDRIIFASGCVLTHPQPIIEAIWNFEFPEDMKQGYGYPELTDEIKRKILGENALRMLGKDPDKLLSDIEGDRWDQERAELGGHAEPWSSISPVETSASAVESE